MTPFQSLKPRLLSTADDEDRLDKLFDRTHQIEREERLIVEREVEDSLKSKMVALLSGSGGNGGGVEGGEGEGEGEEEGEKEDFEGDVNCCTYTHVHCTCVYVYTCIDVYTVYMYIVYVHVYFCSLEKAHISVKVTMSCIHFMYRPHCMELGLEDCPY